MGLTHVGLAFKSTILVLTAFAIVLLIRVAWMEWSGEFTIPFIRTGRVGELAFLLLVGAAIAIVLGKLLLWEIRLETKPKKPHYRRRAH